MTIQTKTLGVTLASAAAAMFIAGAALTGAPTAAYAADGVKCAGINSCKGHGACKTAANDCKGLNACKGQGFLPTATAEECATKGGSVIE